MPDGSEVRGLPPGSVVHGRDESKTSPQEKALMMEATPDGNTDEGVPDPRGRHYQQGLWARARLKAVSL